VTGPRDVREPARCGSACWRLPKPRHWSKAQES